MAWESIGSVDTGEMPDDEDWILFCLKLARSYVYFVCGDGPDDTKLDIMWHEHELGSYPSLGVWYEYDEPCEYIGACEAALDAFNQAISWTDLKNHFMEREEDSQDDEWDEFVECTVDDDDD